MQYLQTYEAHSSEKSVIGSYHRGRVINLSDKKGDRAQFMVEFCHWIQTNYLAWGLKTVGYLERLLNKFRQKIKGFAKGLPHWNILHFWNVIKSEMTDDKNKIQFFVSPFKIDRLFEPKSSLSYDKHPTALAWLPMASEWRAWMDRTNSKTDWYRQFILGFNLKKEVIGQHNYYLLEISTYLFNGWSNQSLRENRLKPIHLAFSKNQEISPTSNQIIMNAIEDYFILVFEELIHHLSTNKIDNYQLKNNHIEGAIAFLRDSYKSNPDFIRRALTKIQLKDSDLAWLRQKAPFIYNDIKIGRKEDERWKTDLSADLGDLGF